MALDLTDCQFQGPALPEPFVKLDLEKELQRLKLLPKATGTEGRQLAEAWELYRRKLRELGASGGWLRVRNQVIEPLQALLDYARIESAPDVRTREDLEAGGSLLVTGDGNARLRVWTTPFNEDLYAPSKRGRAYRYSHLRVAQRVLLASGERMGLLTNGIQLLVLISDPARPDSTVTIPLDPGWKRSRDVPDSFRLLIALASPKGVAAIPELVEKARLQQARVTKELRKQAREAVEHFVQEILDNLANQAWLRSHPDRHALAWALWREGLVTIYRLLFILKLEASDDPARSFSFASTSLWRNTFSPSMALARYARDVLERGAETGTLLETGLRTLFRMFEQGLECTELVVKPLGGALFGANATPTLSQLAWGERAMAWLLDRLLWTPQRRGEATRQRVHYGPLDVEDLGRVYEALLELEPGITAEPMCRLRRQKLEVVVPLAQGEKYRPAQAAAQADATEDEDDEPADEEADDDAQLARGKKTKVEWIEAIPPERFFLRVGLGRKASGSYYTPHSFVRFLVQETLGPQVAERSPHDDPHPLKILELKVLDPAMGSGHFLVEACRFLGDKLYEACRLCDDKALAAERRAEKGSKPERQKALVEAAQWRQRILALPDPDADLVKYLPSRSPEGEASGFSQQRAEALCRRLVATHCLYGVDKNPLAVELTKLALWLESHAEGMPLTFVDHRLVVGDSLTGPFWEKLTFRPSMPQTPIDDLFDKGLDQKLRQALHEAMSHVRHLEESVGSTLADMRAKQAVKASLDRALLPFRVAAAAWSGGVMLGPARCDDGAYAKLLQSIIDTGGLPERIESESLRRMIACGLGTEEVPGSAEALYSALSSGTCVPALSYDLTFPEVFYPTGVADNRRGFHAVVGNPPWEGLDTSNKEFYAAFDFGIFDTTSDAETKELIECLQRNPAVEQARVHYDSVVEAYKTASALFFRFVNKSANGASAATLDMYQCFAERSTQLARINGRIGMVFPSSLHANDGSTGIRELFIKHNNLQCCYSFDNRKKLFEIDSRQKFAVVHLTCGAVTDRFACAFYLSDDAWLFEDDKGDHALTYDLLFLAATTGAALNFLELRSQSTVPIALTMYRVKDGTFGDLRTKLKVFPTEELHTSKQRHRTRSISTIGQNIGDVRTPETLNSLIRDQTLPVCKGEHFHQFDPLWGDGPDVSTTVSFMKGKEARIKAARYFRFVIRRQSNATNERTVITLLSVPGLLYFDSALPERDPWDRPNASALTLVSLCNSYPFDWIVRQLVTANVTFNFLDSVPVPSLAQVKGFLAHGALRLHGHHSGYASLWKEQLGDAWREPNKPPLTWPVLADDDARWAVRAAIDALVADAYGLSREQYAHVLSTFSHASYRRAPELCLERFDEFKRIGLDAFTRKLDPYWDIPLNESLPQPVIDLPVAAEGDGGLFGEQEVRSRRRAP
jgi:hypothetical protein